MISVRFAQWLIGAHVLLVVLSGAASAQGPASPAVIPRVDEDIFVTATIADIEGLAPPRTVAVLSRQDLERLGLSSVIDALRLVPGLDPRARGPRDVQTDFSIRGATFGQNLVLVDGIRLNNSQSGHHNGEIPIPVAAVDRIEVLYGAGSAVHGADALGGTINVISRRGTFASARGAFGQHGYGAAEAAVSGRGGLSPDWMAAGWASRSGGFMFDRDFAQGGALVRGDLSRAVSVDVRHQRRAFGANGFYGNSPSKEWTDQTMGAVGWRRAGTTWTAAVKGALRVHHDHFRWDINRPGFAENRHRTDAGDLTATLTRELNGGRRATVGLAAGADRVTSTNLGDHSYGRAGLFGELITPVTARATAQLGLRADEYSTFGRSLSPSAAVTVRATDRLRFHVAANRAFRVPTFTELYYSDPANLGSPDLAAERGWSFDTGVDWISGDWAASFSPFVRWDESVIDWTRTTPSDRWRSTNVRDVTTRGFEAGLIRRWTRAMLRLQYSRLDVNAPALGVLSKYVLEYARHQAGVSMSAPLGRRVRLAVNVDHRDRLDGQTYQLVSARLTYDTSSVEVFVDGTNLLNENYREIAGVAMPGRWLTAGISLR